jgi:hypothetical protein
MLLINFSHPVTAAQREQLERHLGQPLAGVLDVPVQLDLHQPLVDQVRAVIDSVGWPAQRWQTELLLVKLPSLEAIAACVLAELHGRTGYFPTMVRLRPVSGSISREYEVAELISLQDVRDAARTRRQEGSRMIDAQASAAIRIKVYLAALLLAISGSYLASEVYALVAPAVLPVAARVVFIAAALVLLCVGSQLAGRAVTQILRLHTRRLNKSEAEPRRVLVFFLSALQQKKGVTEENDLTSVLPGHLSLSWDLDADLRALAEYKRQQKLADTRPMFWSWEQPLRGIHHNWRGGKLERLILICSHESIQQAHWFTQIVQKYGVCDDVRSNCWFPTGMVRGCYQPATSGWTTTSAGTSRISTRCGGRCRSC